MCAIPRRLENYMAQVSPEDFLEAVYQNLLDTRHNYAKAKAQLEDHIKVVDGIYHSAQRYQDKIKECMGGADYTDGAKTIRSVLKVVGWLDDLLCEIMQDPSYDQLIRNYSRRALVFQSS